MESIIIVFLLILITTIKPKYLGILKFVSLENCLSSNNTKIIQYSLIFAFIISIMYTLFKKEINTSWKSIQEGMSPDEYSDNSNCVIDSERDNRLTKKEKLIQADEYIKCAKSYNKKENKFYDMDKSLKFYKAALDIKLNETNETQQDQVAEIYLAMSAIYGDKQVAADCVSFSPESNTWERDEEKCTVADEFGEKKELFYKKSRSIMKKDVDSEISPSPEGDINIGNESIVTGLEVDNVTPKPIYYEPGTVNYGGLGYKPSDVDIAYYKKFKSTPESLLDNERDANNYGFCKQQDNIMINIDEKCNKLSKDVCATTDCCILLGGEKCVQGNEIGPKNKTVYSDTTIKNKDYYYYQGKCYGNCV